MLEQIFSSRLIYLTQVKIENISQDNDEFLRPLKIVTIEVGREIKKDICFVERVGERINVSSLRGIKSRPSDPALRCFTTEPQGAQ